MPKSTAISATGAPRSAAWSVGVEKGDEHVRVRGDGGVDGGADDNFYVAKGSPAIDRGASWSGPATDLDGPDPECVLGHGQRDQGR